MTSSLSFIISSDRVKSGEKQRKNLSAWFCFLIVVLIGNVSVRGEEAPGALADEADAYRRPWVPPAPARTRKIVPSARRASESKPQLDVSRLPAVPEQEDLRAKGVFRAPVVFSPDSAADAPAKRKLRDLAVVVSKEGGALNPKTRKTIAEFVAANPDSPARASLTYELAEQAQLHGDFVAQGEYLKQAWGLTKRWRGEREKRFADKILADYMHYLGRLGKKKELHALLEEISSRPLTGVASEAQWRGREALWFFKNQAEQNVFCGFTAANDVCVPLGFRPIFPDVHDEEERATFIRDGLSLYELRAHSHEEGGDLRIVKRTRGNAVPVPSVVHWNFGHYSAVTESEGRKYRVKDFGLKFDGWIEEDALARQSSGYFLVPGAAKLPDGFEKVSDEVAKQVFGRHCVHARDAEGADPSLNGGVFTPAGQRQLGCFGMAGYRFALLNPGLILSDIPLANLPPFGPLAMLELIYNQRSASIEDVPQHANIGPRWTYAFLEYIKINSGGSPPVSVGYVDSLGQNFSYSWNSSAKVYVSKFANRPRLEYVDSDHGGPGFRLVYPDGFESLFLQPNATTATRYYLSEVRDPQGNALVLAYDDEMRLVSVTNALEQSMVFSYIPETGDGVPADTLKIRKITDSFTGREAKLYYDNAGRLKKIVDPIGVYSEFSYTGNDFVASLKTSYGTTTFAWGDLPGINQEPGRFIEAVDPYGDKERAEANDYADYPSGGVDPHPAPTSVLLNGQTVSFLPKNDLLSYRNTFYWDKKMWKMAPGDYSKAQIINWLALSGDMITGVPGSTKNPLEGRVWYNYPGQSSSHAVGSMSAPSKIVRAVETPSGLTWTMRQLSYNDAGRLIRVEDPEGRRIRWNYAGNGVDLLSVEFDDNGTWKALQTFSDYSSHLPGKVTDASGLETAFTYNGVGQPVEITVSRDSESETVKFFYDEDLDGDEDGKGYLVRIEATDPDNPSTFVTVASYTHDAAGQVATSTDADEYTLAYDYDGMGRVTLITHPDSTTEQFVYDKLDRVAAKTRGNLWFRTFYNALRKPVAEVDPAGRVTQFEWCKCGDLQKIIDPMGRVTHWKRDEQGRVVEKIYPDGSKGSLGYQPMSGRLAWVKEPADFAAQDPTVSYRYSLAGQLTKEDYTSASVTDCEYVYNDPLGRLTAKTESLGTTTFTYKPLNGSTLGAGALAGVNGPRADDTLSYSYDWRNRLSKTELLADGTQDVLWSEEREIDSLGRVKELIDGLGTFAFSYAGNGPRVTAISAPNDVSVSYEYYPITATQARALRLKKIINTVDTTDVSVFEYDYDRSGRITWWKKTLDSVESSLALAYNLSSELTETTVSDATPEVISQRAWRYDPAINRIAELTETTTIPAHYNNLNQLTRIGGGGKTLVEGTLNEPGTVTVNGQPAQMFSVAGTPDWLFQREIAVTEGTNTVSIVATDESSNVTTESYQFTVAAEQTTLDYDDNGNLVDDGTRTFTWDAKNQLLSVTVGGTNYGWSYDSVGRRVEEKVDDVVVRQWIWDGLRIIQERDGSGDVVKNFYSGGHTTPTEEYVYTFDHLGSVREAVDSGGVLRAVYDYSAWGERTKLSGNIDLDRGFTGHFTHEQTGLVLAPYRAYDPKTARWLSRDPIGENGGINLYGYVANDPINAFDPDGLDVRYLNDSGAASYPGGPYGHSAVIVGSDDVGWTYFSKDGFAPEKNQAINFRSLDEFQKHPVSKRYNRFIHYKTSLGQDFNMVHYGMMNNPLLVNDYSPWNECADLAGAILRAGGISVPNSKGPVPTMTIPNTQYDRLLQLKLRDDRNIGLTK